MPNRQKRSFRRRLPNLDQFLTTVESVPFPAADIRCDDHIAVLPPTLLRLRLHDLEAAIHHLKYVGGWCAADNRQMNRYHVRGAELPREQGWNLHGDSTIY